MIKTAFIHPEQLATARSLKKRNVFLYLLLLAFITAIPTWIQGNQILKDIKHDGQTIDEHLPAFKIEQNQLVTDESVESFIYQTDSIIFTFDPTGKQTVADVNNNTIGTTIGVALLKDRFYLNAPGYPIEIPYSNMNGITDQFFTDLVTGTQTTNRFVFIFSFVLIWLISLVLVVVYNLLYTVFANLIAAVSRRPLRFGDNWKIVLAASTLPTFFFAVLNSFNLTPYLQLEVKMVVTLYFYYLAIRKLPK